MFRHTYTNTHTFTYFILFINYINLGAGKINDVTFLSLTPCAPHGPVTAKEEVNNDDRYGRSGSHSPNTHVQKEGTRDQKYDCDGSRNG